MARQKSQQTSRKASGSPNGRRRSGTLFIVGTPIGSPDDLTIRARAVLGQVSIVAAETPLATQALLSYHGISATITGYGRGEEEKIAVLLDRLNAGHDIALVSDCGMPVIYDPGRMLITAAQDAGYRVTVVPGPSALTAAAAFLDIPATACCSLADCPGPVPVWINCFRHSNMKLPPLSCSCTLLLCCASSTASGASCRPEPSHWRST